MCGIWSLINLEQIKNKGTIDYSQCYTFFEDFFKLKHRGPDNSFFETYSNVFIGFHRLAIMDDTFTSNQPFILQDDTRTIIFICNGEIYNFKDLISEFNLSSDIKNDCIVIPEIYLKLQGNDDSFNNFIRNNVKGEFAFLLFEFDKFKNLTKLISCRDEVGIRPLYHFPYDDNNLYLFFTSEIKAGSYHKEDLVEFPPGHIITYNINELGKITVNDVNYSTIYSRFFINDYSYNDEYYTKLVQNAVINSVRRRLTADKPIAFLLSGGVDSSLVASLSAKILGKSIRTFCCGMSEGTDLQYARMVAKHIGSNHTEVFFTPEEGLDAIHDVIYTIESWDTTTVRASVGQYLVSKYIGNNTDCKVVLVGEGPDEVCSSYLFNWYAPDDVSLDIAAKEYVRNIHYYDVKRADRCISRWGLEGRVPLLDPEFIKAYWSIPSEKRMPTYKNMEKWWLREAFKNTDLLPEQVLWRKKEAFSDGVSGEKSWFKIIQEWVESKVTDCEMMNAEKKYPFCTPKTKEAYYYRKVFCERFGENNQKIIPGYWQPKWSSDKKEVMEYIDPSARVLSVYHSS